MTEVKRDGNFDHMAEEYDEKAARIWKFHKQVVEILLSEVQSSASSRLQRDQILLEFGCGTGNVCLNLASHLQHVYGIDISEKMLQKAQEKIQKKGTANATVKRLDLTQKEQLAEIGFPTQYDWIVCCMTLHHLPDPTPKLELLTRLLKPTGRIVIVEFATTSDQRGHHHHHHHGHHDGAPPQHEEYDANRHEHEHTHAHKHQHHEHNHEHEHQHEHKHQHEHNHQNDNAKKQSDDTSTSNKHEDTREALKDKYGIFSEGFSPKSVHAALQTLGLASFDLTELPPLEDMDESHPFHGLPIAVMIAGK